jgi:hypothetical protein
MAAFGLRSPFHFYVNDHCKLTSWFGASFPYRAAKLAIGCVAPYCRHTVDAIFDIEEKNVT